MPRRLPRRSICASRPVTRTTCWARRDAAQAMFVGPGNGVSPHQFRTFARRRGAAAASDDTEAVFPNAETIAVTGKPDLCARRSTTPSGSTSRPLNGDAGVRPARAHHPGSPPQSQERHANQPGRCHSRRLRQGESALPQPTSAMTIRHWRGWREDQPWRHVPSTSAAFSDDRRRTGLAHTVVGFDYVLKTCRPRARERRSTSFQL
jgi:hypothetical protein